MTDHPAHAAAETDPTEADRLPALHRRAHSSDRLRFLTDGVFAIVMTLLVLDLPVPGSSNHHLGSAIWHTLPKIAVYLLTVMVLGGMWFRNRTESDFIVRVNHAYNWLTFAWLAIIALIPWSASVVGTHPTAGVAVAVFTINAVLAAAVQQASWWYATGPRGLIDDLPIRTLRASRFVGFIPVVDFAIALAVTPLSPVTALVLNLLAPVAYVTGLLYRLLARLSR